jgi:formate/nitrite transporter FocA (FNT family)
MEGSSLTIFVKAIFAGWIIALLVWMLPAASSTAIVVIRWR